MISPPLPLYCPYASDACILVFSDLLKERITTNAVSANRLTTQARPRDHRLCHRSSRFPSSERRRPRSADSSYSNRLSPVPVPEHRRSFPDPSPQPERPSKRKLDGEKEAHLIALTCGEKPEGEGRWSLRLLAGKLVKLGEVDAISHETVRQVLKNNKLKPWLKEHWCIAPKANTDFVACMEDVLAVYVRAYDPRYPQVCMDEISKQLLSDTRPPLPIEPGYPERQDYEYERHGVCNLFYYFQGLVDHLHGK